MPMKKYLHLILAIPLVHGFATFHPHKHITPSSITTLNSAENDVSEGLFESEGWKAIKKDLNRVPIFSVATPEGNPLAYTVEIKGDKFDVPCFYCDVAAALTELEQTKAGAPSSDSFDIIPFPLGQAFELWATNKAVIVPSKQSILQAGAAPETNPIGQKVPLFACMEIMEEGEDGKAKLPVFMSLEDANAALKEAVGADGGEVEDLEVVCLSLSGCIEQLTTVPDTPAFHFIPPTTSLKYIQDYLS